MWLYKQLDDDCFTVGFFGPDGQWVPETDHRTASEAARHVNFLNGSVHGRVADLEEAVEALGASGALLRDQVLDIKKHLGLAADPAAGGGTP